ncbi:unnamed protein product [Brugia pahangi]|uniref:Uncharacterized protein n=1 Tax=Brugia pahangi TaxID=6280 RepID=A0A3P7S2J6_BRUPA|nr:unnamed protein product [Brugia pahangi]
MFSSEKFEDFIISYTLSETLQLSHSNVPLFTPTEVRQKRVETCPEACTTSPFSGKRFTGRSGLSTSEPVTENDSNYFKLLEADGDSLLVGASIQIDAAQKYTWLY